MAQQNTDTLSVELLVEDETATVKLDRFNQKVKFVNDGINNLGGNSTFVKKLTADFDALEKRAAATRQKFDEITKVRLDNGQIGHLTQEIIHSSERARQLQSDIAGIKKELANPNRKSSIAFLTEELRGAELETDKLNRKLQTVSQSGSGGGSASLDAHIGRLRGFGAIFRAADLGVNESEINAGIAGLELLDKRLAAARTAKVAFTTATTASAAAQGVEATATTAATAALGAEAAAANTATASIAGIQVATLTAIAPFAAIAAIGIGIVKVTQSIREESERRLKVETQIQAAINNQILGQKEALRNFKELQENNSFDRQFSQQNQNASIDELKAKRETYQNLLNLTPEKIGDKSNELFERTKSQILDINAQIQATQQENQKRASDSFQQHWEAWEKSSEDAIQAERKHAAEIENAKKKLLDLKDVFRDSLVSLKADGNPFVKLMGDFETATDKAREKYKDFTKLFHSTEFADKIAEAEKANLTKAIGLLNFDNNFEALKLRQNAQKLAATPERQFADFQRSLEKVNQTADYTNTINSLNRKIQESGFYANQYNPNNPKSFAEFNRRGVNDDFSEVGLQIRNAIEDIESLKNTGLEGTGIYGKGAIADKILSAIPSRDELLARLNSPFANVRSDANFLLQQQFSSLTDKKQFDRQKFSDFLEDRKAGQFGKKFAYDQIGLINNDRTLTDAQKSQRRLSVTDALGNDLDPRLKQQRIQDFVSSAVAKERQQQEAFQIARDTRDYVQAIVKQLAEKGIKIDASTLPVPQVNVRVESKDQSVSTQLKPAPTSKDTQRASEAAYRGGTFFEDYEHGR